MAIEPSRSPPISRFAFSTIGGRSTSMLENFVEQFLTVRTSICGDIEMEQLTSQSAWKQARACNQDLSRSTRFYRIDIPDLFCSSVSRITAAMCGSILSCRHVPDLE